MILVGTINLTRTCDTGKFVCPQCGVSREYRLRSRRPFLTIYFIPVVPLSGSEQFVECRTCKTRSPIQALQHDDAAARQICRLPFRDELFTAAVMLTLDQGLIQEQEINGLIELGNRLLPDGIDREELGSLCSSIRLNQVTFSNYLLAVARTWSRDQRRLAVQVLFLAATIQEPSQSKLDGIARLPKPLNLSESEYKAAVNQAIELGCGVIPAP